VHLGIMLSASRARRSRTCVYAYLHGVSHGICECNECFSRSGYVRRRRVAKPR
jgi:hypothetical protein